jgi:hypothetical protein
MDPMSETPAIHRVRRFPDLAALLRIAPRASISAMRTSKARPLLSKTPLKPKFPHCATSLGRTVFAAAVPVRVAFRDLKRAGT